MKNEVLLESILNFLEKKDIIFRFEGNKRQGVTDVSSVLKYRENSLTWIKSKEKYLEIQDKINADLIKAVIVDEPTHEVVDFKNAIICDNPKGVFSIIISEYFKKDDFFKEMGLHTVIEKSAKLGNNVYIGNNCYIGSNVTIGDDTRIYHNAVIHENVIIGNNCCLKSGVVIGQDGYGYSEEDGRYIKMPHLGSVIIGDNVDIGANTCIDRGTIDDTVIGSGSKIDNLCHIAHNVQIGKNVMVVAGTVICGSAIIEDAAYLAPGAIVRNQITIEEGSLVGMGSVVTKRTDSQHVYLGMPAKAVRIRGKEKL